MWPGYTYVVGMDGCGHAYSGFSHSHNFLNSYVSSILFNVVHFWIALDKYHKSCSELVLIGIVWILSLRRCLFVRMDQMLTWYYKGKFKFERRLKLKGRLNNYGRLCQEHWKKSTREPKSQELPTLCRFCQTQKQVHLCGVWINLKKKCSSNCFRLVRQGVRGWNQTNKIGLLISSGYLLFCFCGIAVVVEIRTC